MSSFTTLFNILIKLEPDMKKMTIISLLPLMFLILNCRANDERRHDDKLATTEAENSEFGVSGNVHLDQKPFAIVNKNSQECLDKKLELQSCEKAAPFMIKRLCAKGGSCKDFELILGNQYRGFLLGVKESGNDYDLYKVTSRPIVNSENLEDMVDPKKLKDGHVTTKFQYFEENQKYKFSNIRLKDVPSGFSKKLPDMLYGMEFGDFKEWKNRENK